MIFHITSLSTYAEQIIQNEKTGCVHSVCRNTVNIIINDHLFALQTSDSPLSPISLITDLESDMIEQFSLKEGDILHFQYENAKIYDLAPKNGIPHLTRHDLYRKFTKIITQSETNGFNLIFQISPSVNQDLILLAAEKKIHEVHRFCNKHKYPEAADKLSELVGLGIGLTPSGDDFLCGVLAGLHIQGKEYSELGYCLRHSIKRNLHRTNEISRAFLSCAMDGHFSLAINELWNNPNTVTISEMFHAIGHSSGIDTLCGIYFLFFLME